MNSDLYDHDTSTSQTERRTTCRSNNALCIASRGNNWSDHCDDVEIQNVCAC